jgi:hypothetical protein
MAHNCRPLVRNQVIRIARRNSARPVRRANTVCFESGTLFALLAVVRPIHFFLIGVCAMTTTLIAPVLLAAMGYSILYLLLGGGLFGAIIIFILARMMGA